MTEKNPLCHSDKAWKDIATGASGDIEIERAWLDAAEQTFYSGKIEDAILEMFNVFCKKQHDYGPMNIAIAGPQGVAIRMVDKFSRLFNLLGLSGKAEDTPANAEEALYDTAMDLADYGIILMLLLNGSWKRATIDDAFAPKERHTDSDGDLSESELRSRARQISLFDLTGTK